MTENELLNGLEMPVDLRELASMVPDGWSELCDKAADEIELLRALLRDADKVVIWEHTPARSGFQEEIEAALGVGQSATANIKAQPKMTDIVQRLYAAIHLESAEIAPRTSALIEAAREAAYVIGKLQNALIQIRRITEEDTILDELPEHQVEEMWASIIEKSAATDKEQR